MKTRLLLLFAAVILLAMAPSLMAQNCFRCVPLPTPHCAAAFHVFGQLECVTDETGCHLFDEECGGTIAATALASDYAVASVERVDEPKPAATDAPLVAPAESDAPPAR